MKTKGGMFSLDASGTIGGVITFAKWKGRAYARVTGKPSNPRSAGQTSTRAMFKFLSQTWASLSGSNQATWDDLAAATNVTPFNAFVKYNQQNWTQWLTPSQEYPATRGEAVDALSGITATAGVKQVTLEFDVAIIENFNWGLIVYRSDVMGFTPTKTDAVGVVYAPSGTTNGTFIDTPVAAGTWYYKLQAFTIEGAKGVASAEVSAVVT